MNDYSRRMAENNDLMDPDWKPDFGQDESPLGKVENLINAFYLMHEQVLKVSDEDLNLDPNKYSITFKLRIETVKEMRAAVLAYRGKAKNQRRARND